MSDPGPATVHLDSRKWPDHLHWQYRMSRLGEDSYGVWLHAPAGTIVRRGTEPAHPLRIGFVALVPDDEWWVVEFSRDNPDRTVYVNIGTPPEWNGDRVTQIDLDLDVVRRLDGSIEVEDEDEFQDHRIRLGYPAGIVASAESAVTEVMDLLRRRIEPFDQASRRWLDLAASAS